MLRTLSLFFLHSSYTFTQNMVSCCVFFGMSASLAAFISSFVLGGSSCRHILLHSSGGSDAAGCIVEEGRADRGDEGGSR